MSPAAVAEERQVLDRRLMMRVGLPYLLPCELLVPDVQPTEKLMSSVER